MKNVRYMSVAEKVARLEEEKTNLLTNAKNTIIEKINEQLGILASLGFNFTLERNINKRNVSTEDRRRGKWVWINNVNTGSRKRIKAGDILPDGYTLSLQPYK